MENLPLLKDIVLLMAVSVPISIVLTRAGLPTIIGFLLTGVIMGPFGLALVTGMGTVDTLAQVGMVLLLFTIGLEFSLTRMLDIRREGILGGGLQVAVTVAVVLVIGLIFKLPLSEAALMGFIIAPSSTAIVLKLLMDKGEVNSPQGNLSIGILLFQDICVVLMVMVVQTLGAKTDMTAFDVVRGLGFSILAFGVIVAAVAFFIPRLFHRVVKLRNREVFILSIVLVCLGTAWLASRLGLSLAIGAFIAGIAISESEYSNQIVAEVVPLRDTFASLFFISIGMLLNFEYLAGHLPAVAGMVAAIIVLKTAVIAGVVRLLKYPPRLSIAVGLTLSQIGEFSFILIKMGEGYGLLGGGRYQTMLAASIITMAAAPFIFQGSSKAAFAVGRRLGGADMWNEKETEAKNAAFSNHVIIIGYGLNGKNLAKVLKETGVRCVIVDVNMDRIREAKAGGHQAYFGDSSHPEILKKMGVMSAKIVVVAISDPISARRIVKISREMNPAVSVLVRTRYIKEVEDLYKLGANQVIPEEFETSVEIFARVLKDYRIPGNIIQNQIDLVRNEGYAMLRTPSMTGERLSKLSNLTGILEASLMDTFYVEGSCPIAGKTINDVGLRKKTGATIIAVVRNGEAETNPGADFLIKQRDVMVILGNHAQLNAALELLNDRCPI
ncbi:MAG: cation:proton antiporter [Deltaproteobacteria bacterium]|nr:cation:proton antiporter [Deltaproteobacteria bacterium]